MHPRIVSVASEMPRVEVDQSEARSYAADFFKGKIPSLESLLRVFEHAQIEKRHICVPKEWFGSEKSLKEKNNTYIEAATNLGETAARSCLEKAGLPGHEVDHIVFVSSTGMATPSIDARLVNRLGMSIHVSRLPVWGLGCAGGAMGLSHAARLLSGQIEGRLLLVAVELCSLTFLFNDFSKSNLISLALFGDGAAAVLLAGAGAAHDGPQIVDTQTTTWRDSLEIMGWNFLDQGLQVVFSKRIPSLVLEKARSNVVEFLARSNLQVADINHFIIHPGGLKVIEAYQKALDLKPDRLEHTRETLREYGNVSSVTVLLVLKRLLESGKAKSGDLGYLTALGPGFSAENVLLKF